MEVGDTLEFNKEIRISDYIVHHSWVRQTIYGPVDFGFTSIDFERAARDLKEKLPKK